MTTSFDPTKYTKSKFVKGGDLPRRGVTATISNVYEHYFETTQETKPALDFEDFDQSMILNKTQVTAMIELFSADVRLWVGQRINLLPVPSNYQGKPTILIAEAEAPQPTVNGQPAPQPQRPQQPAQQYSREDYAANQQPVARQTRYVDNQQPEPPAEWSTTPPPF